jgi:6-phosphogluconolactonase
VTRILIGGYTGDKGAGQGITVLDGDQVVAVVPAESPSWITRHPRLPVLYAVAEAGEGRVYAWSLADGVPVAELGCGETGGAEPAHLTVDPSGRFLITANYTGSSISVHRIGDDGSIGERTDLVSHDKHGDHPRQSSAHPHMIAAAGDGLLVIDLGADTIYRYHLTTDGRLQLRDAVDAPAGSGPRHALAVGGRFYVTAEHSGQVLVYDTAGKLEVTLQASKSAAGNLPSGLESDGRYLFVANRGPNTVSVFALDSDMPRYVTEVPTGDWPRSLALESDLLYVSNERSHEVQVMRIDPATGIPALAATIAVPSPTVVLL